MKSGAVEFIEKPFNGQTLLEKVQQAIRYDAERLGRDAAQQSVRSRLDNLTDKEREVLRMIQEGRPNKEIASLLAITPRGRNATGGLDEETQCPVATRSSSAHASLRP